MTINQATQLYPSEKHAQFASQMRNTDVRTLTTNVKNETPNK